MTHARFKKACLALPEATLDFPFDEVTEAYRVRGRIFALCFGGQSSPLEANLKCDPALAADLRSAYPDIAPGWHMNHRHWNTVRIDGGLPEAKVAWLVRHSYERVVAGLPRADRAELAARAKGEGHGPRDA